MAVPPATKHAPVALNDVHQIFLPRLETEPTDSFPKREAACVRIAIAMKTTQLNRQMVYYFIPPQRAPQRGYGQNTISRG